MRRENQTLWEKLFHGNTHTRQEDEAFQYVAHRLREGASVREASHDDYVRRRLTQEKINRLLNDPDLVRAVRERLESDLAARGRDTGTSS